MICKSCDIPMHSTTRNATIVADGTPVTVVVPARECPKCGSTNFQADDLREAKATAKRMVKEMRGRSDKSS